MITAGVVLAFYAIIDPAESRFVPKCMFLHLTGLECPGCGSQRVVHALMHGDIAAAWRYNALVTAGLPVLLLMGVAAAKRRQWPRLYAALNSMPAIIIASVAIAAWFIIRNFFI